MALYFIVPPGARNVPEAGILRCIGTPSMTDTTARIEGRHRTEQAQERIRALARQKGPEARLPTFIELRETLGISAVTLNHALKALEAERVLERRHGVGIFVSAALNRRHVAVVCNPLLFEGVEVSPFWRLLMEHLHAAVRASTHESSLHFAAYDDQPAPFFDEFVRSVDQGTIHGVLGLCLDQRAAEWLEARGVPLVTFAGPGQLQATIDRVAMVRLAAEALLARGCIRIGLWINRSPSEQTELFQNELVSALESTLRQHGKVLNPALVRLGEERTFWDQGFTLAREVFGPHSDPAHRPDGVISNSERLTQGALVALEQFGATPPLVATHANRGSRVLAPWHSSLICLEVSAETLAGAMLQVLEQQLAGEIPDVAALRHVPRLHLPEDFTRA
jgi:DNA-binding LacI/PurR family transcriptional regulator